MLLGILYSLNSNKITENRHLNYSANQNIIVSFAVNPTRPFLITSLSSPKASLAAGTVNSGKP